MTERSRPALLCLFVDLVIPGRRDDEDRCVLALQKIATVVSELSRNMVLYAGGGRLVVGSVGTDKKCVFVRAVDEGPGIPELDAILAGRSQSRNGRGLGLLGTKRLADGFRVHTAATGTWIEVEVNL